MKKTRAVVTIASITTIIAVAALSAAQPAGRVAVTNTPRYVPRAPSNLTAVQIEGTSSTELKWQNNSDVATHVEIAKRTKNPDGSWSDPVIIIKLPVK